MKKDTIYYVHRLGCLIYVIDLKEDIVIFSAATYLDDLFTTISQYEVPEYKISYMVQELTKETFEVWTSYKNLGHLAIKADGEGANYKFSTEFKFPLVKETTKINDRVKNFKDWTYENNKQNS